MVLAPPRVPRIDGPADRSDCCRVQCAYSVERVRWYLDVLLAFERAGESPDRLYTRPRLDHYVGTPGDGSTAQLDVRRIVEQLRAEGQPISAEAVAARLCPWSGED